MVELAFDDVGDEVLDVGGFEVVDAYFLVRFDALKVGEVGGEWVGDFVVCVLECVEDDEFCGVG